MPDRFTKARSIDLSASFSRAILLVTALVVAANLRPTITAFGSVVSLVAADTGLGPSALGLLGAVPLLAFAAVSPLVYLLTNALGAERAVLISTLVLIVGTLVRSLPRPVASPVGMAGLLITPSLVGALARPCRPERGQLTGCGAGHGRRALAHRRRRPIVRNGAERRLPVVRRGPLGAGLLFAATGSWDYPLLAVIAVAAAQLVLSLYAGRDRFTHPAG